MKKLIAISFLFFYLYPAADLYQLFKVPLLVKHFIEHRDQTQGITLHYVMDNIHDADHEKDMNLPFKSHNNYTSVISNACVPNFQEFSLAHPKPVCEKQKSVFQDDYLLTSFYSNIWQPPKV